MKVRLGFVSNSSSSSYVCDVCHREESGWDLGLRDAEMVECKNGHTFCNDHGKLSTDLSNEEKRDILLEDSDAEDKKLLAGEHWEEYAEDWWNEMLDNIPISLCPVCNFEVFIGDDLFLYLKKSST